MAKQILADFLNIALDPNRFGKLTQLMWTKEQTERKIEDRRQFSIFLQALRESGTFNHTNNNI